MRDTRISVSDEIMGKVRTRLQHRVIEQFSSIHPNLKIDVNTFTLWFYLATTAQNLFEVFTLKAANISIQGVKIESDGTR